MLMYCRRRRGFTGSDIHSYKRDRYRPNIMPDACTSEEVTFCHDRSPVRPTIIANKSSRYDMIEKSLNVDSKKLSSDEGTHYTLWKLLPSRLDMTFS